MGIHGQVRAALPSFVTLTIHSIYKEIGSGTRIALSKLAAQKFEQTGRPLRLAIDTSIWLFQIQATKGKHVSSRIRWFHKTECDFILGGTNPALRTFFYRLLRLLSLSIHPLFVFDGPNKPPFKRNKRTGQNIASVPDFLAKQLLQQFGYPYHKAPGEAEAECALLQQKGVVDAVLSEDVDTLMFGSGTILRNWSSEQRANGSPTHVNVYDAQEVREGLSGLDPYGMILVALMSGGDYTPQGIPGCGPKTACEAARAGFGKELCEISRKDRDAFRAWREKLSHELKTNESKFFRQRHKSLEIPEDFPNIEILGYYTQPAVSSSAAVERLRTSLRWDQPIDISSLRTFTSEAFDWTKVQGAKHFIRNMAPAILIKQLRLRAQNQSSSESTPEIIQEEEQRLVQKVHAKRTHPSTDNCTEMRLGFRPLDFVPLNLEREEPDDEDAPIEDVDEEPAPLEDENDVDTAEGTSKRRTPTKYDPSKPDRVWVLDTYVKAGIPLMVEDWEESVRTAEQAKAAKAVKSTANKSRSTALPKTKRTTSTQAGALHRYTRVTKPGCRPPNTTNAEPLGKPEEVDLSKNPVPVNLQTKAQQGLASEQGPALSSVSLADAIDLCLSPIANPTQTPTEPILAPKSGLSLDEGSSAVVRPRRSPFRKSISSPEQRLLADYGMPSIDARLHPPHQLSSTATAAHYSTNAPPVISLLSSPGGKSPRASPSKSLSNQNSPSKQTRMQDFFVSSPSRTRSEEPADTRACKFRMPRSSGSVPPVSDVSAQRPALAETSGNSQASQDDDVIDASGDGPNKIDGPPSPSPKRNSLPSRQDLTNVNAISKKRLLQLRDSLDGTWKVTKLDQPRSQDSSKSRADASKKQRCWRMSGVEVLDLT
ncbi:MAG: hypothetical protein M1820_009661 [Bogoriella megaspora]|nr:MAG: hypothetical protein M1820_009661 [Bogoriella megaspora]